MTTGSLNHPLRSLTIIYAHGTMTIVMQTVSKSQFKAQALQFLRAVEKDKKPLILTHSGKKVIKILPYEEESPEEILKSLRGTLVYYKNPTKPIGVDDWEALK